MTTKSSYNTMEDFIKDSKTPRKEIFYQLKPIFYNEITLRLTWSE